MMMSDKKGYCSEKLCFFIEDDEANEVIEDHLLYNEGKPFEVIPEKDLK
jgi:hypothetical protein